MRIHAPNGSNSDMSDECLIGPGLSGDDADAKAPTERDPRAGDEGRLAPGVALSLLWWPDDDVEER